MLPFLAGLALGSALTILYAKRDEVKKTLSSPAFKDKVEQTKIASQQALSNVTSRAKEIFANFSSAKAEKSPRKTRVKAKEAQTPSKDTRKATTKSTRGVAKKTTESKSKKTTTRRGRAKKTSEATSTNTALTNESTEAN